MLGVGWRSWLACFLGAAAAFASAPCAGADADETVLREAVIEAAGKSGRITFYIDMMGRPSRARLVGADAKGIEMSVRGMTTPLGWEKISPKRFAGLARKVIGKDAGLALALARYCASRGLREEAEGALEVARAAGAPEGEVKAVMAKLRRQNGPVGAAPAARGPSGGAAGGGRSSAEGIVEIHVEDRSGTSRRSWPVTGGVPFGKGAVRDAARLGIAGRASQVRVLSRWTDGSVKWALFDYQADVPANGSAAARVIHATSKIPDGPGNTVRDGVGSITVDTGAVRFSVSKSRFEFISELSVDLDGDRSYGEDERAVTRGGQDHFIDLLTRPPERKTIPYAARDLLKGTSRQVKAAQPTVQGGSRWMRPAAADAAARRVSAKAGSYSAAVVEHGPMRTVVRLKGTLGAGAEANEYTIWIHAYAGRPFLRVQHNFVFRGDCQKDFIRRMGLSLPVDLGGAAKFSAAGLGGGSDLGRDGVGYLFSTGPHDVMHLEHGGFGLDWEARGGGAARKGRRKTAGWIDVTGPRLGVTASFRDMACKYPKELSYDASSRALTAWLWPDHGDLALDMRASGHDDGMQGVSFTHDVLLAFHGPGGAARAAALAAAFDDPPRPYANAEWYSYRGTRAAGMIMPHDDEQFPKCEAVLATRTAFVERAMTEWGWLGMLNYGDLLWAYRYNDSGRELGTWGLGNRRDDYGGWRRGSTMISYRMYMQYLRTGEPRYLKAADAHLEFLRDALIKHYSSKNAKYNGLGRRHSAYWGAGKGNDRAGGTAMDGYGTNWLGHYIHWNLSGDWRTHEVLGELRDCWNRLGNTVLNQISGGAYVGLKLTGGIPGHEGALREADRFLKMGVDRTSKPGDYWRDCTWWFGYSLYLPDADDPAIRKAILDFWKRARHGPDNYRMYWQRDSTAAVYWAAEGDDAVRKACYDELLKYGISETAGDRRVPGQLAFYKAHGVKGCFTCDMPSLERVVAHSIWRAKDDIMQQQWGEPLSMAVVDHYRRQKR